MTFLTHNASERLFRHYSQAINIILRNVGVAQMGTGCCVSVLTQMGEEQPSLNRLLYYVSHCEIPFHELSELSVERVLAARNNTTSYKRSDPDMYQVVNED